MCKIEQNNWNKKIFKFFKKNKIARIEIESIGRENTGMIHGWSRRFKINRLKRVN